MVITKRLVLPFLLFFSLPGFGASLRYMELADSADYFISIEKWDIAEMKILEALRLEPANFTNSLLLSNLGTIRTAKGEYEKALESFELALSIAPSSAVIYNNRARTFLLLDKKTNAKNDIEKSLLIDRNQEWPLQTLGIILVGENQPDSARIVFEELSYRFPDNYISHSGLGAIAEFSGDNEEALKEYDKALNINPDDIDTLASKILLLINLERYQEARQIITKAILAFPEEAILYLLRGYLHRLNFRQEEAQADRKIAIEKGLEVEYVEKFIPARKK